MVGGDTALPRVQQHEAAGAVRVLGLAGPAALACGWSGVVLGGGVGGVGGVGWGWRGWGWGLLTEPNEGRGADGWVGEAGVECSGRGSAGSRGGNGLGQDRSQ